MALFDALQRALRDHVDGEIRFDRGTRAVYSTDASNYREVPIGVVVPRSIEAAARTVEICADHDVPVLSRGGGTSLAGQCCNTAVIIDWSKHCTRTWDTGENTVVTEPGTVLDDLTGNGLMFGPKPATHNHCTIGGMIGNDACGATAQAYGKTSDNVLDLEVLTYGGTRFWTSDPPEPLKTALKTLANEYEDDIRARFPKIPRRVSGYGLDALLPENGHDLTRALVGSESTLVTVLRARLKLVPQPRAGAVAILGFRDVFEAADAAPSIAPYDPIALEGMDDRLIEYERARRLNLAAIDRLPKGGGWLVVQFGADTPEEAEAKARDMAADLGVRPVIQRDVQEVAAIREAAVGATAGDAWPGWEDSAVPPERIGDYLRDLRRLQEDHGYGASSLYGHFGHGCVHTRIPFRRADYRAFVEEAADLVVSYGGSFSGEHGDGLARGELWPKMFGDRVMAAFTRFKQAFDPRNRMNPGRLIDPDRLDDHLKDRPREVETVFTFRNGFAAETTSCAGVGECRRDTGGVMCPSFRVTRDEQHSTRGRARLLFEMLQGDVITDGWRSPEVKDALDLCLSCKGCRSDCPVHIDMATYKAEFLHHYYRGRIRPLSHYALGWLPLWARFPLLLKIPRVPGLTRERDLPRPARVRFSDTFRAQKGGPEVLLLPDTFTDNFTPRVAVAATRVLTKAGFSVRIPRAPICCGLTWISTGQLGMARRVIRRTARILRDALDDGIPFVGLEPSCTSVLRSDAPELLPDDPDVRRLANRTRTLAELLDDHDIDPPHLPGRVVTQPHCHQHAIMGTDADLRLLRRTGADVTQLDAGCCGLAGNFGFEPDHYDLSMAVAEQALFPALRASAGAKILADGFSCRTQIEHGTGIHALHLAEFLASQPSGPRRSP
ncbi:FAD-binding and (Fe-S)-binding domain-containing protein [Herbidospora mongoliensis]|uniref:FAD-binding and (Fe-S)-binding domain-containing protein n=1 Tax=Herbidospora mongoliensis TaxID=688067 RepID=UPI0008363497|nr:FAD-binding and (Fe-S)-binding domain-containing protein [Herbidospora mongoliensis]